MFGQLALRVSKREETILSWQRIMGLSSVVLDADGVALEHAVTCAECLQVPASWVVSFFPQGLLKNWFAGQTSKSH